MNVAYYTRNPLTGEVTYFVPEAPAQLKSRVSRVFKSVASLIRQGKDVPFLCNALDRLTDPVHGAPWEWQQARAYAKAIIRGKLAGAWTLRRWLFHADCLPCPSALLTPEQHKDFRDYQVRWLYALAQEQE